MTGSSTRPAVGQLDHGDADLARAARRVIERLEAITQAAGLAVLLSVAGFAAAMLADRPNLATVILLIGAGAHLAGLAGAVALIALGPAPELPALEPADPRLPARARAAGNPPPGPVPGLARGSRAPATGSATTTPENRMVLRK
ncbi:hypothetical protein [Myceligenerans crystallogenes]|uniref:Holin-X, holin superfamily III n=1 Tax=Myceligenerans crystallogenes TaxID=316335 RepID=A0ABN2NDX4_9MICO